MTATTTTIGLACWNRIGISGDQSCPELETYIHCRNCPVFESGAREFFQRDAPEGYLAEWATLLSEPVAGVTSQDLGVLIFRLRDEWFALRVQAVVEVTTLRPIHRIPHRSNEILVGMINLRGRLRLQVSMHGLLGVGPGNPEGTRRLVVISRQGQTWVFDAEEVLGVHRLARERLGNVPSTLSDPERSYSQAVIDWEGRSVGLLDHDRVFESLKGLGS
jgi:chemotaxis-related protein WspD